MNPLSPSRLADAVLSTVSDAIVAADKDGIIRFWNPGAERIFGYASADAVGQSLDIIIPQGQRQRHWQGYRQVMATGESRYGRGDILAVPATRKDGRRISVEFTIVALRDESGAMAGMLAIMRDVTARFEEMRALRHKLADATRGGAIGAIAALNHSADQARRSMSMLKEHEKVGGALRSHQAPHLRLRRPSGTEARTDEPGGLFAEGLAGALCPQGGNARRVERADQVQASEWLGRAPGLQALRMAVLRHRVPTIWSRDLLETHGIEGALLNCFDAGGLLSAQASTEESIVLAAAYNDYFIEEWLSADKRLKYAPAVPTQDPVASAAEIRRVGKHPQVAAIFVPLVNMLMGHRYYWPIYEACQELGLPVYIHVTGIESIFCGTPTWGWGRSTPTSSAMRPSRRWAWQRGKPHFQRHAGEISGPQVHLCRVRLPVGAVAPLPHGPYLARAAA